MKFSVGQPEHTQVSLKFETIARFSLKKTPTIDETIHLLVDHGDTNRPYLLARAASQGTCDGAVAMLIRS